MMKILAYIYNQDLNIMYLYELSLYFFFCNYTKYLGKKLRVIFKFNTFTTYIFNLNRHLVLEFTRQDRIGHTTRMIIPRGKISRKYRIKLFHIKFHFRETKDWKFVNNT